MAKSFEKKYPHLQQRVDAIASFIEACQELEMEPFFSKDDNIGVHIGANENHTFILGDRFHFRSALISFRRLWMPSELSYWKDISRILTDLNLPSELNLFSAECDLIEDILKEKPPFGSLDVKREKIVDLWLNTVFAHDGLDGPNKRSEFESIVDQFGHAHFEYEFRFIIKQITERLQMISKASAKPALAHVLEKSAIKPSFRIGAAFGKKKREITPEGHIIIRKGPSDIYSEETMEARFSRILDRSDNRDMKSIFLGSESSKTEVIRAALGAKSIRDFISAIEGTLNIEEAKELKAGAPKMVSLPKVARILMHISVNFRGYEPLNIGYGNEFITTAKGEPILDVILKKLQDLLLKS